MTVLLVEDDENLSVMLAENLEIEGFNVVSLRRGEDVLPTLKELAVDVVLMDVNLNGALDGFDTAEGIRANYPKLPIIFTTGKAHFKDLDRGFKLGYVDYQKKPFGARELIARIGNILNRDVKIGPKQYSFGGFAFIPSEHNLIIDEVKTRLTKTEASFMSILCENMNTVVSKEDMSVHLWGKSNAYPKDHSLNNLSHRIRKYLDGNPYVELVTISKVGYRLVEKK